MRFEFATAARIIFGPGVLRKIGPVAAGMGKKVLVVTGLPAEYATPLLNLLADQEVASFAVENEPTIDLVRAAVRQARDMRCDLVIGFGGGSALDSGKAVAALLANEGDPLDYVEVIGRGQPLTRPPVPYIAIPTTAGTGAEVTRNAVLASPEHHVKVSLRSPLMLPAVALIDPELTYSLPPNVTAYTGLDALTQLIEPYVSIKANPMTDALCHEGIARAARSLRRACESGDDSTAREDMALASLFGGLALANAGLGAVHGFAGPFGGMFPAPHGAVCASLLPYVMAANLQALQSRQPESPVLRRYEEIARWLTGDQAATAHDGVEWIHGLCRALHIPALSSYGLTEADFTGLIDKAAVASSMQANPVKLTASEMRDVLSRAL
jgi:alcohol dehydrogenase class IV